VADILDRCLLPMVNEAARCLEEGLVTRPLDVDLGMVMGTGFPPFRGGLLRWADDRGVASVIGRLDGFSSVSGRFTPSDALRARREGFHDAPAPVVTPPSPSPEEPPLP
jgi:3-hydroxyacyl-CoA dehydrogenase